MLIEKKESLFKCHYPIVNEFPLDNMYFSNSHSQSEECVLLENDYMNQDYHVNNGTNSINTKLNGNIINVNEYFQNIRKKRNKRKKYFNVTTDYVPMNSDSSETVNNTSK